MYLNKNVFQEDDDEYLPLDDNRFGFLDEAPQFSLPKNGTGLPMMLPGPSHLYTPPAAEEVAPYDPELIGRMMLADAQRMNGNQFLLNRVAYDCIDPSPLQYTTFHQMAGAAYSAKNRLKPYYIPLNENDTTLVFESRFESGNLRRAIQVFEFEYDLILKFDINTRGHTQWYYFSVNNVRKGVKYKFNIINLMKKESLYNDGMKPLVYSDYDAKTKGRGWVRGGFDVCYYQNSIKRKNGYYYSCTFSYIFENDGDTYYFAYCYPYTFTDLQNYLRKIEEDPARRRFVRRRTLCQSLAGNNCDILTITSFTSDPQAMKSRKGVFLTARVHPGESNSSWMMKGIIDFLTGPSYDAKVLRDNFVFKIVPMLNPDGVINGNYRCSLAGVDLNRRWSDPSPKLHPSIYHSKNIIKRFAKDRQVVIFCDLHGHSRKKNIFIYGCEKKGPTQQRLESRVFPRILWKLSHNFSFQDCAFEIQRSKESTARVVVSRMIGIVNSMTMEASFCGSNFGVNNGKHFHIRHLEQMGQFFCESILDYCDPEQTRVQQVYRELFVLYPDNDPSAFENVNEDSFDSDDEPPSDSENPRLHKLKKKKKKKIPKEKEKEPIPKEKPIFKEFSDKRFLSFPEQVGASPLTDEQQRYMEMLRMQQKEMEQEENLQLTQITMQKHQQSFGQNPSKKSLNQNNINPNENAIAKTRKKKKDTPVTPDADVNTNNANPKAILQKLRSNGNITRKQSKLEQLQNEENENDIDQDENMDQDRKIYERKKRSITSTDVLPKFRKKSAPAKPSNPEQQNAEAANKAANAKAEQQQQFQIQYLQQQSAASTQQQSAAIAQNNEEINNAEAEKQKKKKVKKKILGDFVQLASMQRRRSSGSVVFMWEDSNELIQHKNKKLIEANKEKEGMNLPTNPKEQNPKELKDKKISDKKEKKHKRIKKPSSKAGKNQISNGKEKEDQNEDQNDEQQQILIEDNQIDEFQNEKEEEIEPARVHKHKKPKTSRKNNDLLPFNMPNDNPVIESTLQDDNMLRNSPRLIENNTLLFPGESAVASSSTTNYPNVLKRALSSHESKRESYPLMPKKKDDFYNLKSSLEKTVFDFLGSIP